MIRANYIGAPQFFDLNQACRVITDAFGLHLYLVGSSLTKRDYRDVDLRLILPDEDYDRMFPGIGDSPQRDALWSLMCSSISLYLSQHSGLPVDFQIQQRTAANAEEPDGQRNAIGLFVQRRQEESP